VREEDSSSRRDKIVILEIKILKKNQIQVYCDGSDFIFDAEILSSVSLHAGDEISSLRFEEITLLSDKIKVRRYALSLLSRQRHTRKKLQDKILRLKANKAVVCEVLDELESLNLIDDSAYARDWLSIRMQNHPEGKNHLYLGLLKKGINKNIAQRLVAELVTFSAELDAANRLLDRNIIKKRNPRDLYTEFKKRGFSNEVIREITKKNTD
jgi:SOS response regulatory protein OraA/RecX